MFGIEILDVMIGLFFIYLLLSLVCTAINEYVSVLTNRRGKMLFSGIRKLLEDSGLPATVNAETFFQHKLIAPLFNRGFMGRYRRKPSYIPARTFAMALLDWSRFGQASGTEAQNLDDVLKLLQSDAVTDVSKFLANPTVTAALQTTGLTDDVKTKLLAFLAEARSDEQKLHDSVEVWFNNAMDRVSGAYKRYTQAALLVISIIVAFAFNADTIQIWRTLSSDDTLREGLAQQATQSLPAIQKLLARQQRRQQTDTAAASAPGGAGTTTDSTTATNPPPADSAAAANAASDSALAQAKAVFDSANAMIGRLQLKLGWDPAEAAALGLVHADTAKPVPAAPDKPKVTYNLQGPWNWHWDSRGFWAKLLGLLLTAAALSMGAPFWFDTLNKVINIRGTGRAPDENPRRPAAAGTRPAEQAPK